jgi:hypothetical protein
MFMKLTPGVNFVNVLCTAFMLSDPKSVKDTDDLTVFFMLLGSGSTSVKAVCRTLMKLPQGGNFINVFRAHFLYECLMFMPKCN